MDNPIIIPDFFGQTIFNINKNNIGFWNNASDYAMYLSNPNFSFSSNDANRKLNLIFTGNTFDYGFGTVGIKPTANLGVLGYQKAILDIDKHVKETPIYDEFRYGLFSGYSEAANSYGAIVSDFYVNQRLNPTTLGYTATENPKLYQMWDTSGIPIWAYYQRVVSLNSDTSLNPDYKPPMIALPTDMAEADFLNFIKGVGGYSPESEIINGTYTRGQPYKINYAPGSRIVAIENFQLVSTDYREGGIVDCTDAAICYTDFSNGMFAKDFGVGPGGKGAVLYSSNPDYYQVVNTPSDGYVFRMKTKVSYSHTGEPTFGAKTGILATSKLFASSTTRIVAKFAPFPGVTHAIWWFHGEVLSIDQQTITDPIYNNNYTPSIGLVTSASITTDYGYDITIPNNTGLPGVDGKFYLYRGYAGGVDFQRNDELDIEISSNTTGLYELLQNKGLPTAEWIDVQKPNLPPNQSNENYLWYTINNNNYVYTNNNGAGTIPYTNVGNYIDTFQGLTTDTYNPNSTAYENSLTTNGPGMLQPSTDGVYPVPIDNIRVIQDNQWHTYEIEWHTGDRSPNTSDGSYSLYNYATWKTPPSVIYKIDGITINKIDAFVPVRASRLVIGAINNGANSNFGSNVNWQGYLASDLYEAYTYIKSIEITPLLEPNDDYWAPTFEQPNILREEENTSLFAPFGVPSTSTEPYYGTTNIPIITDVHDPNHRVFSFKPGVTGTDGSVTTDMYALGARHLIFPPYTDNIWNP